MGAHHQAVPSDNVDTRAFMRFRSSSTLVPPTKRKGGGTVKNRGFDEVFSLVRLIKAL